MLLRRRTGLCCRLSEEQVGKSTAQQERAKHEVSRRSRVQETGDRLQEESVNRHSPGRRMTQTNLTTRIEETWHRWLELRCVGWATCLKYGFAPVLRWRTRSRSLRCRCTPSCRCAPFLPRTRREPPPQIARIERRIGGNDHHAGAVGPTSTPSMSVIALSGPRARTPTFRPISEARGRLLTFEVCALKEEKSKIRATYNRNLAHEKQSDR